MANVVTHPHLQVDFPRPVNPSHAPLGFGFGLSTTPAVAGWAATPSHVPPSPWHLATNTQSVMPRPQKRRHEPDEESENRHSRDDEMDRSPTPERPKRAVPKRARTTPTVTSGSKEEKAGKASRSSVASDENDVDVGVLLASLPPQSLLPLLTSLLASQPTLKSAVLSLIPRPTLETATQALDNSANKLRDAYPYSNTPFSQPGPSASFGFGSGSFGNNRSNSQSATGLGFGRPASAFGPQSSSSQSGGSMRDEYILSRLRPHINDFVAACQSYLPYFSSATAPPATSNTSASPKTHVQTHAAALQSQHKDRSHPTETFLFLSSLTAHVLNQPPLTQSALVPMILPRLIEEWKAWLDRVDQVVNREGGMFGSETVRTWERCLDEFAHAQGNGLEILKQLRDHWVLRVGWLVGRQPMQEL